MSARPRLLVLIIFGIPFTLGMAIVTYWYISNRVEKKVLLPTYGTVPEFRLTSEERSPVSRRQLLGKITIADFIFTQCAGACPVMSSKMSELQQSLLADPHAQFVSISVDPETDTPEVLRQYAKQYGAVSGRWRFLTGDRTAIYGLTRDGFHLGLDIEGDSAIIHSQKFVLIDQEAGIRGYYDMDDSDAVRSLLHDTRILSSRVDR
jgi:protein SCO1/2